VATRTSEQRKVVTVLFCDVVGSTALGESTDPEALRALLARYFELMKASVERHGGTLEKFIGDAVMAVFGEPAVHEDDALRACRAAGEMLEVPSMLSILERVQEGPLPRFRARNRDLQRGPESKPEAGGGTPARAEPHLVRTAGAVIPSRSWAGTGRRLGKSGCLPISGVLSPVVGEAAVAAPRNAGTRETDLCLEGSRTNEQFDHQPRVQSAASGPTASGAIRSTPGRGAPAGPSETEVAVPRSCPRPQTSFCEKQGAMTSVCPHSRELAERVSNGTHVRLLWRQTTRQLWVEVRDADSDRAGRDPGASEQALDAFHHSYGLCQLARYPGRTRVAFGFWGQLASSPHRVP
jgi:Adenylate and Guanylate cyclase catalytic domain